MWGFDLNSMPSLIDQIQQEALDESLPVSALLRKALAAATKLGLEEARDWIDKELSGWQGDMKDLPEWRWVRGDVKAQTRYHGWQPVIFQSAKTAARASKRPFHYPVAEIETLIEGKTRGDLVLSYDPEIELELQRAIDDQVPIRCVISLAAAARVLDEVRNKVLRWSLALEKAGVHGQGLRFTPEEKRQAQSVHFHIHGPTTISNVGTIAGNASIASGPNAVAYLNNAQALTDLVRELERIRLLVEDDSAALAQLDTAIHELTPTGAPVEESKAKSILSGLLKLTKKSGEAALETGVRAVVEAFMKSHGWI